jgi:hypothetical protein
MQSMNVSVCATVRNSSTYHINSQFEVASNFVYNVVASYHTFCTDVFVKVGSSFDLNC